MSNRWQLLGGLTLQTHQGFSHSGTYTNPGTTTDFNDPNYLLNKDNSSVFIELPWAFSLSGSYLLPYGILFSGKYTARAGDPLVRTFQATGLTRARRRSGCSRAARIGPRRSTSSSTSGLPSDSLGVFPFRRHG